MNLGQKTDPNTLFYQGRCEDVLAQTVDEPLVDWIKDSAASVLGSLCFLGRVEEADFRYSRIHSQLSLSDQSACLFYLSVGWIRYSSYNKARFYIIENLKLSRREKTNPLIRAFARQGQAFYRHFCGRYHLADKAGEVALRAAIEADSFFLRMLATDLLGHTKVEEGEIARGLQELELAHKLALKLGHGSYGTAISKAIMSYRVQYGLVGEDNLLLLKELIQESRVQDNYSDSYMILELVRQLTVRGQISEAETWLQTVSRAIYASRHRRQRVLMNLRWAEIFYIRNEDKLLRERLDLARSDIDPAVDLVLLVAWQGITIKAKIDESQEFLANHRQASKRLASGISQRIASRTDGSKHSLALGDDPLGDLIDREKFLSEQEFFQLVIESGYLGLLRRITKIPSHAKNFIYLYQPTQTLILGRNGDTFASDDTTSTKLFDLLKALAKGRRSKEELVSEIWSYDYNPLRHDSLLYTLISRLRTLLGPHSDWLENDEDGYGIRSDVAIVLGVAKAKDVEVKADIPIEEGANDLNSRQWSILDYLRKHQRSLGPDECSELFKISKVTATRDLSGLYKAGYILRQGKGRATRYANAAKKLNFSQESL